jgi:hypothetical protein
MGEFDGRVLIVRNFISQEECATLKDWAVSGAQEQFVDGVSGNWDTKEFERVKNRLTNRMVGDKIEYPELVYNIQNRMREIFPLVKDTEVIKSHGKDGVVVSITYDTGDVYKHKDPPTAGQVPGTVALRFNILASKAENGGLIHVEDKTYELNEGDLMAYLVSEYYHSVDQCSGTNPRILFMFGFCADKDQWENQSLGE